MTTKGRVVKLWDFKQNDQFMNDKLAVVDTTNCTSHRCKRFYFKIKGIFVVVIMVRRRREKLVNMLRMKIIGTSN